MTHALIIDACRTPRGIGKAGKGALSEIHPQRLGAAVLEALVERTGIDTADVDDVVWGTNSQRGLQGYDLRPNVRARCWLRCALERRDTG